MEFQAHTTPEAIEARLNGRLEFADHERLRDLVALLDAAGPSRFVVDVSELTFIDSAGLGMLLILHEQAEQRQMRLVVRRPRGDVRRSIELARIDEILSVES